MRGCRGVCVVAGGMRGYRGHAWLQGACVVDERGHAWLPRGACVVVGDVHRIRRDTVNERAVRILLECILVAELF